MSHSPASPNAPPPSEGSTLDTAANVLLQMSFVCLSQSLFDMMILDLQKKRKEKQLTNIMQKEFTSILNFSLSHTSFTHACTYTFVHMHTHACLYTHIHTCTHTCIPVPMCTHALTQTHTHACTLAVVYLHNYACKCTLMHTCFAHTCTGMFF